MNKNIYKHQEPLERFGWEKKAKQKALNKAKETSKADQVRYKNWLARGRDIRKVDPSFKSTSWKEATSKKGWRKEMDM